MNGRNGVIGHTLGAVVFKEIILESNVIAGFEIEEDGNEEELIGYVDSAVIIGRNTNRSNVLNLTSAPHGVIAPRTERYWFKNVEFYNFNFADSDGIWRAAMVGTCSHCYTRQRGSCDSGARTTFFEGIRYNKVENGIE